MAAERKAKGRKALCRFPKDVIKTKPHELLTNYDWYVKNAAPTPTDDTDFNFAKAMLERPPRGTEALQRWLGRPLLHRYWQMPQDGHGPISRQPCARSRANH